MHTPVSILQKYWQYSHFRPLQEEIILNVLQGDDTLAVLPTGAGKSICYQVPALLLDGICIVVTPLIALMNDQVFNLKKRGISAIAIHSGLDGAEVNDIFEKTENGEYKFLFLSPERLKTELFLTYLPHWKVGLVAVDEAHCISQWGYDFRPPYLCIADIKSEIAEVPFIALTASATPFIQQDIIDKLKLKDCKTFFSTFRRENISISTMKVESKIVKLLDILQKVKGTKIVYCKNRRRTVEVSEMLNGNGLNADYYHAGLSTDERNKKQQNWIHNKTEIIVCTNAFGMGIDKHNVRAVLHYDLPDTPEEYYQEIGRAGRDGAKSYAVLLYTEKDITALYENVDKKYPPLSVIKNIYQSLAYYFQVAVGAGAENAYDFETADFCKKFNHDVIETLSAIKILEQQSFLSMSESVYLPSTIKVIAAKNELLLFEKDFPQYDEVLKALLRMYGGIHNHYIPIDEFLIAQKLSVAVDYVQQILWKLHAHEIIHYRERKQKPQITYLHDRVEQSFLHIDMELITMLKKRYVERINFLTQFIKEENQCKQIVLIDFFGEKSEIPCGICANCLQYKKTLTEEEFVRLKNTILHTISFHKSLSPDTYLKTMNTNEAEKSKTVIRFLLDKHVLKVNEFGDLILAQ